MRYTILSLLVLAGFVFAGIQATNATTVEQKQQNVNKVSEIKTMPDDAEVIIQGVIVKDLGDDMYMFQDNTGTVNIEIDEDLLENNTLTPQAIVLIEATVNKDGNITSLEAEEIDFLPVTNNNNAPANNMRKPMNNNMGQPANNNMTAPVNKVQNSTM